MKHIIILLRNLALVAAVMLPLCLLNANAATRSQPDEPIPATSNYSVASLYNRANAYAQSGKIGLAVLNYKRALLLAPDDADSAANLHFVRVKVGLLNEQDSAWTRMLNFLRPNTLAWLGSLGLVIVGLSVLLMHRYPRRQLAFRALIFIGLSLAAAAIYSAATTWPRAHEAVVIEREAPARISPAPLAEPAFTLREGETVNVNAERGGFELVQTSIGRSGWVASVELSRVVP